MGPVFTSGSCDHSSRPIFFFFLCMEGNVSLLRLPVPQPQERLTYLMNKSRRLAEDGFGAETSSLFWQPSASLSIFFFVLSLLPLLVNSSLASLSFTHRIYSPEDSEISSLYVFIVSVWTDKPHAITKANMANIADGPSFILLVLFYFSRLALLLC